MAAMSRTLKNTLKIEYAAICMLKDEQILWHAFENKTTKMFHPYNSRHFYFTIAAIRDPVFGLYLSN